MDQSLPRLKILKQLAEIMKLFFVQLIFHWAYVDISYFDEIISRVVQKFKGEYIDIRLFIETN